MAVAARAEAQTEGAREEADMVEETAASWVEAPFPSLVSRTSTYEAVSARRSGAAVGLRPKWIFGLRRTPTGLRGEPALSSVETDSPLPVTGYD
eukprot:scaffold214383_cov27-Tisochrysis_lutea.AAC.1